MRAQSEDRLVAELEVLGLRYLSRPGSFRAKGTRPPRQLLADLIRQPSSRVRSALVAVLLAHPVFGGEAPLVVPTLSPAERETFKFFYTAAVILQKIYVDQLQCFMGQHWQWLDDWFSDEIGIPPQLEPQEQLHFLGKKHQQKTGMRLNWTGTYENAAHHLLRRWELEQRWNR